MLQFFKDHNVKIYHTYSNLKAVFIERFNRSLRELRMKSFVKNNNTVWYNILLNLIKTYDNRYHHSIKKGCKYALLILKTLLSLSIGLSFLNPLIIISN